MLKNLNVLLGVFIVLAGTAGCGWFIHGTYGVNVDDAYIYFRYIVNFSRDCSLSYNAGEVSFGATSILWVAGLAFFREVFNADLLQFSKYFGIFCHCASALFLFFICVGLNYHKVVSWIFSLFYVLNPFLIASSVSGLETPLNLAVILGVILVLIKSDFRPGFINGALLGLTFLSRPENLVFIGFFFVVMFWKIHRKTKGWWRRIGRMWPALTGLLVVAGPWSAYVYVHSGRLIPSTYKGLILYFSPHYIESGIHKKFVLTIQVTVDLFRKLMSGKFSSLMPGFIMYFLSIPAVFIKGFRAWESRALGLLMIYAFIFFCACVLMFPITMWRYLLPLIPVFFINGTFTADFVWNQIRPRIHSTKFQIITAAVLAAGLVYPLAALQIRKLGQDGEIYQRDVHRMIDFESPKANLAAGFWLKDHMNPDERFAATAIGVVGYFSERYLLDLGGLIDPDVWPVLVSMQVDEAFELFSRYRIKYLVYEAIKVWGELPYRYPQNFRIACEMEGYSAEDAGMKILEFRPDGFQEDADPGLKPFIDDENSQNPDVNLGLMAQPEGTDRP